MASAPAAAAAATTSTGTPPAYEVLHRLHVLLDKLWEGCQGEAGTVVLPAADLLGLPVGHLALATAIAAVIHGNKGHPEHWREAALVIPRVISFLHEAYAQLHDTQATFHLTRQQVRELRELRADFREAADAHLESTRWHHDAVDAHEAGGEGGAPPAPAAAP